MENSHNHLGKIVDLKDFDKIYTIGSDSFSDFFKIQKRSNGKFYSAKILKFYIKDDEYNTKMLKRELYCLQTLKFPSIIKFYGYSLVDFDGNDFPVFITEYSQNPTLSQILWKRSKSHNEWNNTKFVINILGISLAMKYMHDNSLVNRELKPNNILLDSNLYPKLMNFGLSRIIDESTLNLTHTVGTPYYMAPEIIDEDEKYSFEVDVFSFGMILYQFYSGYPPMIKGKTDYQITQNILKGERPNEQKLPGGPINKLIKRCWSQDPKKRPTFNEIIYEFIVHRDKYWQPDVDEKEVENYLAKFGLSLDSDKKSIYAKMTIKSDDKSDDNDDDDVDEKYSEKEADTKRVAKLKARLEDQKQKYELQLAEQRKEFEEQLEKLQAKYESKAKALKIQKQKEEDQNKQIETLEKEVASYQSKVKKSQDHTLNLLEEEDIRKLGRVEEIGFGKRGRVYKVLKPEFYALKEMLSENTNTSDLQDFVGEYECMNMLQHPNILKAFGILMGSQSIQPSILLECCKMNLETAIKIKSLSSKQIVAAIYQIAEGMKYSHYMKIIHLNLTPTNILLAYDGTIKIGGFRLSHTKPSSDKSIKFMPPEIINEEENCDEKVDVYSFGSLVYFMINDGNLPNSNIYEMLSKKKAEFPSSFTKFSKELIRSCCSIKPKDRPSFKMIVDMLAQNNYNLIEMEDDDINFIKSFVKKHKENIPKYEE